MKMNFIIILLATLFLSISYSSVFAQNKIQGNVSGQVKDNTNKAVSYATIALLSSKDSSLVKSAITNERGEYSFEKIPFGKYFISISSIGMYKADSPSFSVTTNRSTVEVPTMVLKPSAHSLKEVQVSASKPFIKHKPGQTVVNVQNSMVNAGNTAMEVLEKSPGVLVDQDGNISLNGKRGVNVMINGRPTHLSAKQLSTVLKGMPASSVSKIELMTQPPAKYAAEGTAGLINLVLKKNTELGFNGSLDAGIGYNQNLKYNAGGSINYKNKHFSLYSNYKDRKSVV